MSHDPITDRKVKQKLTRILASWNSQYKDDLSMKTAANLYQHRSNSNSVWRSDAQASKDEELEAAKRKNKEEARQKEAERLKREKEEKKKREDTGKSKSKRKPFNFEQVLWCFLPCVPSGKND